MGLRRTRQRTIKIKKRTSGAVIAIAAMVSALSTPAPAPAELASGFPRELESPPGQLSVVTINAKQSRVLDVARFERLHALAVALRSRPPAFNGGSAGAVAAPDVILLQEMRSSNVEILQKLLNQRSNYNYSVVFAEDTPRKFLVNSDTVSVMGEPVLWVNPCQNGDDSQRNVAFFWARLTENATGLPFIAASIHLPRKSNVASCRQQAVETLRAQFAREPGPVIVGGDFNSRPMVTHRECDLDETSQPKEWYSSITAPSDGGRSYVDTVRQVHRAPGRTMEHEWTHEGGRKKSLCDGSNNYQRSRIDYLFVSETAVAEAHADHPGWAGEEPGTRHPDHPKYSDHRFVWSRLVLTSLPRPPRPESTPDKGGLIHVQWQPVEGATSYILYRAVGKRAYAVRARLPLDIVSYDDSSTDHGRTYRYSVAPVAPSGGEGVESRGTRVTADARGPQVVRIVPRPGARGIPRRITIKVRFDEPVFGPSVGSSTIELRRDGRRVRGRVKQESPRVLSFDPRRRLRKKTRFKVVVHAVRDRLGNRGAYFSSWFRT